MFSKKLINPKLEISEEPKSCIKCLETCQTGEQVFNQNNPHNLIKNSEIALECKLVNFNFDVNCFIFVIVTLVPMDDGVAPMMSDNEYSLSNISLLEEHPFFILKCLDPSVRFRSNSLTRANNMPSNGYVFEIDKKTMKVSLGNLCAVRRSNFEVKEFFEKFDGHFNGDGQAVWTEERKLANSKKFRLKLQVVIDEKLRNLAQPVFTRVITNKLTATSNQQLAQLNGCKTGNNCTSTLSCHGSIKNSLKILRCSRFHGSCRGGDEIILLTNYIDQFDIQVLN